MRRNEALAALDARRSEIEQFGVKTLALFGSVARDEAGPESDVDILVEFDRAIGLFGFVRLKDYLEQVLGCPVDLVTPDALRPQMRDRVLQEAVRAVTRLATAHTGHP
ncbi:MAG TPA: nucleotidyltransferase family protein [Chloroflexota bacterium]|nr:nucleotidyltransferase family protein [Chloroflexota bacterium]